MVARQPLRALPRAMGYEEWDRPVGVPESELNSCDPMRRRDSSPIPKGWELRTEPTR